MKMQIADKARDLLKEVLKERSASGIRVYFAGFGWGGPEIGLALDEPEATDIVTVINEIEVALDIKLNEDADTIILEYDELNDGLVILGGSNCW